MVTANDFGLPLNWVRRPDGSWIYGRFDETNIDPGNAISATPPPPGTSYWTAGSTGDWKLNTYTGDAAVSDYTAPNAQPSMTSFKDANPNLYPEPTVLVPNQPPPGGWTPTSTYDDIFGKPTPPAPATPQRPGTVPGSVWNNPDSEAPRGYNPELWAQREIGPNRTYAGGVTGMGIGGPTNQDGTAIYTPPPEVKPTRDIDPFGYEPAPAFQRQDWEGRFSGGPDVLSNAQGNTFERNLLTSIAEAAASPDPAVSGRAKFILSAASNPNVLRDMPVRKGGLANLIDRAGYQYDMENGGGPQRRQSTEAEGKPVREGRDRSNPFMSRMAKGTMDRSPYGPTRIPNTFERAPGTGPDPWFAQAISDGVDPYSVKNKRMFEMQNRAPVKAPVISSNPFMANLTGPVVNPAQRTTLVGQVPVGPNMGGARMPVMTQPSQSFPVPTQRGPVLIGQPHASEAEMAEMRAKLEREAIGRPIPQRPYMDNSRPGSDAGTLYRGGSPGWYENPRNNGAVQPNPFLMGGATRGSRNPFR